MHFADQQNLFALELRPECLRHEMGTCLGPCACQCTRTEYLAQLRAARAFLGGHDTSPLTFLEEQLKEASERCQYERAASIHGRLERLQYLHDRLELLREPALPAQFIYPVQFGRRQLWYFLAGGRVVAAAAAPENRERAEKCLRRMRRAYQPGFEIESDADRPARQVVSAWFRSHRDELNSILSPEDAERYCRVRVAK
jgi:excinuclease ABC subunit C